MIKYLSKHPYYIILSINNKINAKQYFLEGKKELNNNQN